MKRPKIEDYEPPYLNIPIEYNQALEKYADWMEGENEGLWKDIGRKEEQIKQLEGDNRELQMYGDQMPQKGKDALDKILELEGDKKTLQLTTEAIRQKMIKQIEEIKELKEFVKHKRGCVSWNNIMGGNYDKCTCGLEQALKK